MENKKLIVKRSVMVIMVIVLILLGLCVYAKIISYKPSENAKKALKGTEQVTVIQKDYITFLPEEKTEKGLIFYPGGLVEPQAYAPLCLEIAKEGYVVVIASMPINLMILSPNKANGVLKKYSYIKEWWIAGHSLGGVMACKYAKNHENIKGLVLLASYPQKGEWENPDMKVLSIYGSLDTVADLKKMKNADLPEGSKIVSIEGGNHSNFGGYGLQKGDSVGKITRKEQYKQTVKEIVKFIEKS